MICQRCGKDYEEEIIELLDKGKSIPRNDYCIKCNERLKTELKRVKENFDGKASVKKGTYEILRGLGVNCEDPNFSNTDLRVGRLYNKVFYGLKKENEPIITAFPNDKNYNQMVILRDIPYDSFCSHHLVPFSGKVSVAYIPDKDLIGLSKINDIVNYFAAKPQLQEGMTEEIADFLVKKLNPKGAMVIVTGIHFCMKLQGYEGETMTSAIRGIFEKQEVRSEALMLIKS